MANKRKAKIKLKIDRPDLATDFSEWLKKHDSVASSSYWDWYDDFYDGEADLYGEFDVFGYPRENDDFWSEGTYDDDLDTYANYWNSKAEKRRNKANKRGKRGKKNKKHEDDYDSTQINEEYIDGILSEKKEIYFYDDIEDPQSVHKFTNLRQFYIFLDEQGIDLSDSEGSKFIRETVRHCCVNPLVKEVRHQLEIVSDHSYGALSYEVSEDAALFRD